MSGDTSSTSATRSHWAAAAATAITTYNTAVATATATRPVGHVPGCGRPSRTGLRSVASTTSRTASTVP